MKACVVIKVARKVRKCEREAVTVCEGENGDGKELFRRTYFAGDCDAMSDAEVDLKLWLKANPEVELGAMENKS